MGQLDNNLEEVLRNWQEGRASLEQIRKLSAQMGELNFAAGIPVLIQLLDHDDEIVRYNAAMSLGFDLHHKPATDKLISMLADDGDEDVRDVAAGALKTLWQGVKAPPRVLEALAEAALNDPDEDVRRSAYKALLIVNGVSEEEYRQMLGNRGLAVDPTRVRTILDEIPT